LTEYYSESESDPKLVGIRTELEAAYAEKTGPSITLTNAEGVKRKTTAPIAGPSHPDYAKVAMVGEWSLFVPNRALLGTSGSHRGIRG